jgi:hypothetical protein
MPVYFGEAEIAKKGLPVYFGEAQISPLFEMSLGCMKKFNRQ